MLAIGLMSGTSADGVTAALVELSRSRARVIEHRTLAYPAKLRRSLLAAGRLTTREISRLNVELGEIFARAANGLRTGRRRVRLVGSHGQTVWHGPDDRPPHTLQLAEPAVIAERTGLTVVADFRPGDMAAGGQGAPLVPAFDEFLFGRGPLRAAQNIGGVANVSLVGRGRLWSAFDTGPGNCLMDLAARLATGGRLAMDEDGRLAGRGRPDLRRLERMLRDPYFLRRPPKSLERTRFAEAFLRRHFGRVDRPALPDALATLCLFTARTIADSYRRFLYGIGRPKEVVVSGGGALNPVLMERLRSLLAPIPVVPSDARGIAAQAKEAAAFAWLAARALAGSPNHCPQATGARRRLVLGKIIRP